MEMYAAEQIVSDACTYAYASSVNAVAIFIDIMPVLKEKSLLHFHFVELRRV